MIRYDDHDGRYDDDDGSLGLRGMRVRASA
jgi:hypothetical protein